MEPQRESQPEAKWQETPPFVVLVGIDFSDHSTRALDVARGLAQRSKVAELHVVHVVPPPVGSVAVIGSTDMAAIFTESLDRTRRELQDACTEAARLLSDRVYGHIRTGRPAREIAEVAREVNADLVVVGTHGRTGLRRALLGSVAEEVVRHAPCDVLTVRYAEDVPAIEPPCPGCLAAQTATKDPHARCETHQKRVRTHVYSDGREAPLHESFRFD